MATSAPAPRPGGFTCLTRLPGSGPLNRCGTDQAAILDGFSPSFALLSDKAGAM